MLWSELNEEETNKMIKKALNHIEKNSEHSLSWEELKEEANHWRKEAERISHEAIGARLEVITLKKQLDIAFKTLHKFAFDYDDTTKPRVFIENSLVALGDMREV